MYLRAVVLCGLLSSAWCGDLDFPPGFKFGTATASYQVEGAWNVSDKAESIWDHFTHEYPDAIRERNNGDVACDSYHNWKEDVQLLVNMGVHFYRFSISWPRLLPNGYANKISEDGSRYYNDLIDELLKNDIEPVITLYHWDLPQKLQELGGWINPLIVDWFGDYARVVYSLYADRVKNWLTINEPLAVCDGSYNYFLYAPPIVEPIQATYICNKNLLMAHAKAWRIYDEEFKPAYNGKVSIANHLMWFEPLTPEDSELTELVKEYYNGRYTHAIYSKEGGWPPAVEKIIEENSKEEGYPRSKLPPFTEEEKEFVKGTHDYFALNHYFSRMVRHAKPGEDIQSQPIWTSTELNMVMESNPAWGTGASELYTINPEGLRHLLASLKNQYGDLEFFITENGYGNSKYDLEDDERIMFFQSFLNQTLLSIKEDDINLVGFTAWTLLDNFEWQDGYLTKFGLHQVDFSDPKRTRTPRKSAHYYKSIIASHSLDVPLK